MGLDSAITIYILWMCLIDFQFLKLSYRQSAENEFKITEQSVKGYKPGWY